MITLNSRLAQGLKVGGGGGGVFLGLESLVKFTYIHKSHKRHTECTIHKFYNFIFISSVFQIHAPYSSQFTDHVKPLPDPACRHPAIKDMSYSVNPWPKL